MNARIQIQNLANVYICLFLIQFLREKKLLTILFPEEFDLVFLQGWIKIRFFLGLGQYEPGSATRGYTMVFILDGVPFHYAHIWSKTWISIC